jgi:hypothetical protein
MSDIEEEQTADANVAPELSGTAAMANAMAHVLAKKSKRQGAPILSRSKSTLEMLEKEKQDKKQAKVT